MGNDFVKHEFLFLELEKKEKGEKEKEKKKEFKTLNIHTYICYFQFLLDKTGPMLITAKLDDITNQILL